MKYKSSHLARLLAASFLACSLTFAPTLPAHASGSLMDAVMSSAPAATAGVNFENGSITVTGMGVAPPNAVNIAQARMLARRAAVVDGYRQLAESISGVSVTSESTVESFITKSDTTKTKVAAVIKGARIVSEQFTQDGGYQVTMTVPMFGVTGSLASAVLPEQTVTEPFPQPDASVEASQPSMQVNINIGGNQPIDNGTSVNMPSTTQTPANTQTSRGSSAAPAPKGKAIGGYTGLIVDCRGLGLRPVMSPVIKNANGQPIYGYKNLNYDKVVENGMAGYTSDISRASRAGSNPLIVKAVALENHDGDPVISTADANRVLIENGATGFLDRTNVVFVR